MELDLLPAAIVLTKAGAELVPVAEVEGVLVARADGAEIDLVNVVVVVGLPAAA